eukprot:g1594.t1
MSRRAVTSIVHSLRPLPRPQPHDQPQELQPATACLGADHLLQSRPKTGFRSFSFLSLGRYDPKSSENGLQGLQNLDQMLRLVIDKKRVEDRSMQDVMARVEAFITLGKHYHSGGHHTRASGYFGKALEECRMLAEVREAYLSELYATGDSRKKDVTVVGATGMTLFGTGGGEGSSGAMVQKVKRSARRAWNVMRGRWHLNSEEDEAEEAKARRGTTSGTPATGPRAVDDQLIPAEEKLLLVVEKITGRRPPAATTGDQKRQRGPSSVRDALLKWLEELPILSMLAECHAYVGLCLMEADIEANGDAAERHLRDALEHLTSIELRNKSSSAAPPAKSELAEAYNNLGACLQRRESYQKAIDYYQIALDRLLEYYEGDDNNRYICLTYYNLGCCKWYLNGGGREEMARASELCKRMFEKDDPERHAIEEVARLVNPAHLTTTPELQDQFQDADERAKAEAERAGKLGDEMEGLLGANAKKYEVVDLAAKRTRGEEDGAGVIISGTSAEKNDVVLASSSPTTSASSSPAVPGGAATT